jgi:parvulin-like peptidyl-prolyl isomerase
LLLAAPALVAQTAATTIEEILVAVNAKIITRKAFQQQVEQQYSELYRRFSGKELDDRLQDAREKTLQEMIDRIVLLDVAAEKEITQMAPTEKELLDDIKSRYSLSDSDLERAIKSELGLSLSEFANQQRQSVIIDYLLGQEVYRKVPVEDQEARLYYNEHQNDFHKPARFRIRELVLPKGATDSEVASAREKAAKVKSELDGGASFESLVNEHSTSPSKGTGGDLGWVDKGLLRKSIEDAALSLKQDEISDVIETDTNFILIQLIGSELEGVKPFETVKAEIVAKLREPKAENALQHYLQSQRIRANIRYLVPKEQIIKG